MPLAQANNYLAVNLHRLLAEEKTNVFFSPLSISTAMTMLLCAAEGQTESEMKAALGYDQAGIDKKDLASLFEKHMSDLNKNPNLYRLSCANLMLSQKNFKIKEGYKQMLVESFRALVLEVDFMKENQKAVNQINEWVSEETKNMIPELVQSFDPATVLVLLNAVYFKGSWFKQFEKEETNSQVFYNGGSEANAKAVDMMHMDNYFQFYEDKTLQVLKLPYVGEELAMLILLPRAKNGLEAVESSLTPLVIEDLKPKLMEEEVVISLPRFRLEYTKSLVPCFKDLGVERVFREGAELDIASDSPDLAVSEILHKAVLEVNEESSEAAAATIDEFCDCSCCLFTADHPFAFVIYDTRNDLILFMGRVNDL